MTRGTSRVFHALSQNASWKVARLGSKKKCIPWSCNNQKFRMRFKMAASMECINIGRHFEFYANEPVYIFYIFSRCLILTKQVNCDTCFCCVEFVTKKKSKNRYQIMNLGLSIMNNGLYISLINYAETIGLRIRSTQCGGILNIKNITRSQIRL